jgi:iron complex outermembrane receptor protein
MAHLLPSATPLDWSANDNWRFAFDYHDSSNKIDNGADKGLGSAGQIILGSDQLTSKVYDYRTGDIPHYLINWNNGTNQLDPGEIDSNFSQFIHSPGESDIQQAQFNTNWYPDFTDYLVKVDFGASYTKQSMSGTTAWSGLVAQVLIHLTQRSSLMACFSLMMLQAY